MLDACEGAMLTIVLGELDVSFLILMLIFWDRLLLDRLLFYKRKKLRLRGVAYHAQSHIVNRFQK